MAKERLKEHTLAQSAASSKFKKSGGYNSIAKALTKSLVWVLWYTSVIPAIWEANAGRSEASLDNRENATLK